MARKLGLVHKGHQPPSFNAEDPRAVRSREALRRAFLELLEIKALDQITIQEITERAGVGYVTFFRHHGTKEALLNEIAAAQIRRLVDLTLPVLDAVDSRAASLALCSYVNEHRALWSTLLTGGAAAALREEYVRVSREVAEVRAKPGYWLPSDIAGILFVSSTLELLTWWLRQANPIPVEQVAEMHDRVITSPIIDSSETPKRRRPRSKS
ncbi:MAG: TetR/AcrR family transcriptional regulator [Sinobacteraceae bacterium]|nr:TetR/AcrR family transcriptional regulator [Nevskiaceae bacterium]